MSQQSAQSQCFFLPAVHESICIRDPAEHPASEATEGCSAEEDLKKRTSVFTVFQGPSEPTVGRRPVQLKANQIASASSSSRKLPPPSCILARSELLLVAYLAKNKQNTEWKTLAKKAKETLGTWPIYSPFSRILLSLATSATSFFSL